MSQTNRHHISVSGDSFSGSRFARRTVIFPKSIGTAVGFLNPGDKPKTRGAMLNGKFQVYWVSSHRSPSGVKYNRLLRLRRRLFMSNEQASQVNGGH
ncbi:hypothetical protein [Marinobacter sp.]|uniref:hypothetical protein n=1 Tax=Marinobacter sp. TaxID=50741 RepID=UPI0035C721E6